MKLTALPVDQKEAFLFIGIHHRHLKDVLLPGCRYAMAIARDGEMVGAAVMGRPVAQKTNARPGIMEIARTCVLPGVLGGNSKLYRMCSTIAAELGYWKIQTFTLESESGVSLKAAGFFLERPAALDSARRPEQWGHSRKGRTRNLFGEPEVSLERKNRWVRILGQEPGVSSSDQRDGSQSPTENAEGSRLDPSASTPTTGSTGGRGRSPRLLDQPTVREAGSNQLPDAEPTT